MMQKKTGMRRKRRKMRRTKKNKKIEEDRRSREKKIEREIRGNFKSETKSKINMTKTKL